MKRTSIHSENRLIGTSGFTLLELMIALVILAFGLMGVAGMVMTSVRGNAFSSRMTQATALAQDKIEEMRNTPYGSLYFNCSSASCTGPPANMPLDADGTVMLVANDGGVNGDELTGGAGDGIWTYMDTSNTLPTGMTLVWAVRRNYPEAGLIWLLAVAQWEEGKPVSTNLKDYDTCVSNKNQPVQTTDSTYRVCVESMLGNF